MSIKLNQALELLKAKKYKKALANVKKINSKPTNQSFLSLQIEGVCLSHQKKNKLAKIALTNAVAKATNNEEKIEGLTNLYKLAIAQNYKIESCDLLKQLFILDSPTNALNHAKQICLLSFDAKDYSCTSKYSEKLFLSDTPQYSQLGAMFLFLASVGLKDLDNIAKYSDLLLTQILNFTAEQTIFVIQQLKSHSELKLAERILKTIEPKYKHQEWFQKEQSSLNAENDIVAQSDKAPPIDIIVSDNISVKNIIEELINKLVDMGAKFHKHLRFIEKDGDLSIKSYSSLTKDELQIQIPAVCMPILSDYDITLKEGRLQAALCKRPINPLSAEIMQSMISLYNATNKMAIWHKNYPLLALKSNPELIDNLFKFRPMGKKISSLKQYFDNKHWNELAIKSFLGSREFAFKKSLLSSAGLKVDSGIEKGLLTIIDFLNHRMASTHYLTDTKECTVEIISRPDEETNELSVQYGILDPVLTYLTYGFVDTKTPILFSGNIELNTISGLKVFILSASATLQSDIKDQALSHLEYYLPAGIEREKNNIFVSDIIIPNENAESTLTQVLGIILKKSDYEGYYQDDALLKQEITHLKKQIVLYNYRYWQAFNREVAKTIVDDNDHTIQNLLLLGETCKEHIRKFAHTQNISLE